MCSAACIQHANLSKNGVIQFLELRPEIKSCDWSVCANFVLKLCLSPARCQPNRICSQIVSFDDTSRNAHGQVAML